MRAETRMILSHDDAERLAALVVGAHDSPALARLDEELERAHVVEREQLPADVVTLGSRVVYENLDDGKRRDIVLVYPEHADLAAGRLSVLSPVGAALLGLRAGQTIEWPLPRGRMGHLRILSVEQADATVDENVRPSP
jgi:regulator of nucleoside diphosphate kinase